MAVKTKNELLAIIGPAFPGADKLAETLAGVLGIEQQDHIADAVVAHAVTGVDGVGDNAASKADTDDALDALGVKVNAILAALEAAGIQAES